LLPYPDVIKATARFDTPLRFAFDNIKTQLSVTINKAQFSA